MKKFSLLSALIFTGLALLSPAHADLEMTQKLTSGDAEATVVTRFKTDNKQQLQWVRADQADGISLVTDFKKKQVLAISDRTKTAAISRFRKLRKQLPNAENLRVATATNRTEKIGDLDTTIYEGTLRTPAGEATLTLWVAKDHPQQAQIVPLMHAYTESPVLKATAGLAESLRAVPGVVVKSEVRVADQSIITTLTAVEEKSIPNEVFEIPSGYFKEKK